VACSFSTLFAATTSIQARYCGWRNETFLRVCPSLLPAAQCHHHFFTHWCSFGTYDGGYGDNTIGSIKPSSTTISATLLHHEALPTNALTDPNPDVNDAELGCTVASLGRAVTWRLEHPPDTQFTVHRVNPNVDWRTTELRFALNNSALGRDPRDKNFDYVGGFDNALTPYMDGFDPTRTYSSRDNLPFAGYSLGNRRDMGNMLDWSVRFDASSGYMELESSWYCMDKSPSTPYVILRRLEHLLAAAKDLWYSIIFTGHHH
jgi:hypothetical protein